MMDMFFRDGDEIMLKWQKDFEVKLETLHEKLKNGVKQNCLLVYTARKDRLDAEKEKEELSTMIQEKVQELVKILGAQKLTEKQLTHETWDKWMETIKIKPLTKPNIEDEVKVSIISFFSEKHIKFSKIGGLKLTNIGGPLQMDIKPEHVHHKNKIKHAFQMVHLMGNKQKPGFILAADAHTFTIFTEVSGYVEAVRHSGRNFSSQIVTELLQIIYVHREIKMEFQFTDEYVIDVAVTSCGYAVPVFEEMANNFRKKHDPSEYL